MSTETIFHARNTTHARAQSSTREVKCLIVWCDGSESFREFDACEEAWAWEQETRKQAARRRAKKDRRFVRYSFSYGITTRNSIYMNMLYCAGRVRTPENDTTCQQGDAYAYERMRDMANCQRRRDHLMSN